MHWRRTADTPSGEALMAAYNIHPPKSLTRLQRCVIDERAAMSGSARNFWRRLEELADSPDFAALVEREVPRFRDGSRRISTGAASCSSWRPRWSLAALSGCGPEPDPQPARALCRAAARLVPGVPRHYATASTRAGYAEGVLLEHQMGRPVKVEGNPDHPASLGAASAIMQASILTLYDPRRAQSIIGSGQIAELGRVSSPRSIARRQALLAHRRQAACGC